MVTAAASQYTPMIRATVTAMVTRTSMRRRRARSSWTARRAFPDPAMTAAAIIAVPNSHWADDGVGRANHLAIQPTIIRAPELIRTARRRRRSELNMAGI